MNLCSLFSNAISLLQQQGLVPTTVQKEVSEQKINTFANNSQPLGNTAPPDYCLATLTAG